MGRRGRNKERKKEWCEKEARYLGIQLVQIRSNHIAIAYQMTTKQKEQFERLIIETANEEKITLLTGDRTLHQYADYSEVEIVW